jgi:hypothetical protein
MLFETKNSYKLFLITDFLNKCSKKNIEWSIVDCTLYGLLFEEHSKIIALGYLKFDNYFVHEPFKLDINNNSFIEKVNVSNKNECKTQFEFLEDRLCVKKHTKTEASTHFLTCKINYDSSVIQDVKLLAEHLSNHYTFPLSTFVDVCSKFKNCTNIKIKNFESKLQFLINQTDLFEIKSPNNVCINSYELNISSVIFSIWKKSQSSLSSNIELSFSENNLCIFLANACHGIKICLKSC